MIAFDAAAEGNVNPGTSLTYSHTCSGTNRILLVGVRTATDVITGVTYAGTDMTLVDKRIQAGQVKASYLWRLLAPATGANDIVISASSSVTIGGTSVSLAGADQAAPEASAVNSNENLDNITNTISTVTNNAWIVTHFSYGDNTTSFVVDNSQVNRADNFVNGADVITTNGSISPASSQANKCTAASNTGGFATVAASIAPAIRPGRRAFPIWL